MTVQVSLHRCLDQQLAILARVTRHPDSHMSCPSSWRRVLHHRQSWYLQKVLVSRYDLLAVANSDGSYHLIEITDRPPLGSELGRYDAESQVHLVIKWKH